MDLDIGDQYYGSEVRGASRSAPFKRLSVDARALRSSGRAGSGDPPPDVSEARPSRSREKTTGKMPVPWGRRALIYCGFPGRGGCRRTWFRFWKNWVAWAGVALAVAVPSSLASDRIWSRVWSRTSKSWW